VQALKAWPQRERDTLAKLGEDGLFAALAGGDGGGDRLPFL
jgi:hypothetical protein